MGQRNMDNIYRGSSSSFDSQYKQLLRIAELKRPLYPAYYRKAREALPLAVPALARIMHTSATNDTAPIFPAYLSSTFTGTPPFFADL